MAKLVCSSPFSRVLWHHLGCRVTCDTASIVGALRRTNLIKHKCNGCQGCGCLFHTSSRNTVATSRYCLAYGEETSRSGWQITTVFRQGTLATERGRMLVSHKVEVNGAEIHYEQVGTGKNIVLLLPGALGSTTTDFKPQLDNINKDMFTLIAWDPRGYGKSIPPARDWPAHYFERDAEDAAKLMQTMGAKQFSMLGWSDGGITAMIVAGRYPNLVRKLVVWGANSYVTKEEIDVYNSIRDIDTWSKRMKQPMIELYGEEYFREQWGKWIDAISRYYTERGGNICQDEVDKIECPTLILHGDKDALVPGFHPEYLHQHIKNSRLIRMPEGKHNLHLKYHHQFNSIAENFLLEAD